MQIFIIIIILRDNPKTFRDCPHAWLIHGMVKKDKTKKTKNKGSVHVRLCVIKPELQVLYMQKGCCLQNYL